MVDIHEGLLALENQFWTGDAAFYRESVDRSCLVAFTEMSGVTGNAEIAATAGEGNRWKRLEIVEKGFLQPSPDVALPDGRPYRALVSTGYVRRGQGWRMMFHAQTPLE